MGSMWLFKKTLRGLVGFFFKKILIKIHCILQSINGKNKSVGFYVCMYVCMYVLFHYNKGLNCNFSSKASISAPKP